MCSDADVSDADGAGEDEPDSESGPDSEAGPDED